MTCRISDEYKLHWSHGRGEDRRHIIGLTVCRLETHVTGGDMGEGRHVAMASDGGKAPWGVFPDRENENDREWGLAAFRR